MAREVPGAIEAGAGAGAGAGVVGGGGAAAALAFVRSRWREEILALRRSICERWRFCDLRTCGWREANQYLPPRVVEVDRLTSMYFSSVSSTSASLASSC